MEPLRGYLKGLLHVGLYIPYKALAEELPREEQLLTWIFTAIRLQLSALSDPLVHVVSITSVILHEFSAESASSKLSVRLQSCESS